MYEWGALAAPPGSAAPAGTNAHPIAQLVRAHLSGSSRTKLVPWVPASDFHEAVARHGSGVDHAAGEVPIALIKLNLDSRSAARGNNGNYIVTDRRLFGRAEVANSGRTFSDVPYAQVTGVAAPPGSFSQSMQVLVGQQPIKLYLAIRELQQYFTVMAASIPPPYRTYGPAVPPQCSPPDEIGARGAAQAVGGPDARTWVPLRVLFEAHRRGMVDAAYAASMVAPMTLAARATAYGRGGSSRGWSSVLPRPVLGLALRAALGEPAASYPSPHGDVFDFAIGAGSGAGRAALSSAVGLALFATVGVGFITTSHGQRLGSIRVQVADNNDGDGSTFQLLGTSGAQWESLSMHWWRPVDMIHQSLLRLEARYLLARALFGNRQPPQEMLSVPRDVLESNTAQLIGPTNLAAFYPS